MRIVEHYDVGMVVMECVNFWWIFGYRDIRVAVMDRMADIVIWGGKLFRPRKEVRKVYLIVFIIGFITGISSVLAWALTVSTSREEARRQSKLTNEDALKEMSPEFLSVFLKCPYGYKNRGLCADFKNGQTCDKCKLEWLGKEAPVSWKKN